MKPDSWFPLYFRDLLAATQGMSRADFGSYVLLLCSYYENKGPIDSDDETLRLMARCDQMDWARTRGVVGKRFEQQDGKWVNPRADKELAEMKAAYDQRLRQTSAASKARNEQRNGSRNVERNVDTTTTTTTTISTGTATDTTKQRESAPPSADEVTERNLPEYPNLPLVMSYAATIGLPDWKATDWFDEMEGCGWVDHNGRQVHDWRAVLRRVKTNWEAKGRPSKEKQAAPKGAVNLMVHNDELKRIEARLKTLRERYDSNAGYSKPDAEEIKRLTARRKELRELLGVQV